MRAGMKNSDHSLVRKDSGTQARGRSFRARTLSQLKRGGAAVTAVLALMLTSAGAALAAPGDGDTQSRIVVDPTVTLTPDESYWSDTQDAEMTGATPGFVQLSAGYNHAAVVSNGGVLYAWGLNSSGQLGNGAATADPFVVPIPVDASGALRGETIKKVAVGLVHTAALTESGRVFTWGANGMGQLGDGTTTRRESPVEIAQGEIPPGTKIVDIAVAGYFTAAVDENGNVYDWGNLYKAQNEADARLVPTLRTGLPGNAAQVVGGGYDAMVLTTDGKLYGWGTNGNGRLGDGTTAQQTKPVAVNTSGVLKGKTIAGVSMSISNYVDPFTVAWDIDGKLYSWGRNAYYYSLGTGSTTLDSSSVPVAVDMSNIGSRKIVDAKSGVGHTLALADDGTLFAWGLNYGTTGDGVAGGQLGIGATLANQPKPVQVTMTGALAGQAPFKSIAAGSYASFALGQTGEVFSWGSAGSYGLLGNGDATVNSNVRVPAKGPWFGELDSVLFGDKVIAAADVDADEGIDWTTLQFEVPAYDQLISGPGGVDVDVTARFNLMTGSAYTGLTADWPPANYHYYGDPELSWHGEPEAELAWGSSFVEGGTVVFGFSGVATGETGLADTSFTPGEFTGTGTAPTMTCAPSSVNYGESFTCTGTYRLTTADIRKGRVSLTGAVSATYDGAAVAVVDGAKTATLAGVPQAELVLKKTATSPTSFVADEVATYKFTIENTGDGDVDNISIVETAFEGTEANLGDITCTKDGEAIDYPVPSTQQGDVVECTANYTLTQADIDRGHVKNTAEAQGVVLPGDENETPVISNSSSAEVKGDRSPALDFKVYSDFDTQSLNWAADATFKYYFQAINNGPTTDTVESVTVPVGGFNGTGTLGPITCDPQLPDDVVPGDAVACWADYTLTQEDVDNVNPLSITGQVQGASIGQPLLETSTYELDEPAVTSVSLVKAGSVSTDDEWKLNASNTYTFYITNTGTATLSSVKLTDIHGAGGFSGENPLTAPACIEGDQQIEATTTDGVTTITGTLPPGATWVCATNYQLTQKDVDGGRVENTASVAAEGYGGQPAADESTAPVWMGNPVIDLTLIKDADDPEPFQAGSMVTYTFTVGNDGNATATNVKVMDEGPRLPGGELAHGTWSGVNCAASGLPASNVIATLLPGEQKTCTATYVLTQEDADAGVLTNVANSQGTDPGGEIDTSGTTDPVPAGPGPEGQEPSLGLTVTGTDPLNPDVGSTVTFDAVVTNDGVVTVAGVDLTIPDGFTKTCTPTLPASLAPGSSSTCKVTYKLTQEELDAQELTLDASAKGAYNSKDAEAEDSDTVTWDLQPSLSFEKTVSSIAAADYKAGTTVTFTFALENTGNATLNSAEVLEGAFTGVDADGNPTTLTSNCVVPSVGLAPGETLTCTADYTLSQGDIDNAVKLSPGPLANTAAATAKTVVGEIVPSNPSTAVLGASEGGGTISPDASVSLVQNIGAIGDGEFVAGTEVPFTFTVTNSGAVTLDGIDITYDFGGTGVFAPTCTPSLDSTFKPGDQSVCSFDYELTQIDVDRKSFTSEATAKGKYGAQTTAPVSVLGVVTGTNTPKVSIAKTASVDGEITAGAEVTYTFTVKNEGPVSVSAIGIVEQQFDGKGAALTPTCADLPDDGELAPGSVATCTATYTLIQADLDQGGVTNTATANATPVDGTGQFASVNEGSAFVGGKLTPSLSLEGSVTSDGNAEGSAATYTWTVTNTGQLTVTDVDVTMNVDDFTGTGTLPTVVCDPTELAPGAQTTCTGTYTLTQDDVNAGAVSASATATGEALGAEILAGPENADLELSPETGLLAGTENTQVPSGNFAADQSITVPVTVKNTGETTVENVGADFTEFQGTGTATAITCDPTTLNPGETADCWFDYTLTQEDVDNGGFDFKVAAQGDHSGTSVTEIPVAGSVQGQGVFDLNLTMSATNVPQADFKANTDVAFTFTVENTGKVTVLDVGASAQGFTGNGALGDISCSPTNLVPGEVATCTSSYTLTQEDIDQAGVALTGVASGTVAVGTGGPSNTDVAVVGGVPVNHLTLAKSVERAVGQEDDPFTVDDEVTYTFALKNEGNGTLNGLTLSEDQFSGSGDLGDITCTVGTTEDLDPAGVVLAPGAQATCAATYALTKADLESGSITNLAVAGMKWGASDIEPASAGAALDLGVVPILGLDITGAALDGDEFKAGAKVDITYKLTNGGPIDLTAWAVAQGFNSDDREVAAVCENNDETLAVDASVTCTFTYTLTQADVDAGALVIKAQGSAASLSGDVTAATFIQTETVEPEEDQLLSELTIWKNASALTQEEFKAGAELTYTFTVENTGFTTLSDVEVVEGVFTGAGDDLDVSECVRAEMGPGALFNCEVTYTLAQADVDAGTFSNTATATGTEPVGDGKIESKSSTATTTVSPLTGLTIQKTARDIDAADFKVGAKLVFDFEVTNTGNATLTDVEINDAPSGEGELGDITCTQGDLASMAPGDVARCSVTYTLTQADVDRGYVENSATASGTGPGGEEGGVETEEPGETTGKPEGGKVPSSLSIAKTVDESDGFKVGSTLTYTFKVTNTGNTTLKAVSVVEGDFTGDGGNGTFTNDTCTTIDSLAPGTSSTCTKDYVLTQADLDAGEVRNSATAKGTSPTDERIESASDEALTTGSGQVSMSFEKTAQEISSEDFKAGGTLFFNFRIENTGDVTLMDVKIDESAFGNQAGLGALTCSNGSLAAVAPGQVLVCTMPYTLTQADIDNGGVANTASATAKPATGGEITEGPDTATGEPAGGVKSGLRITKTVPGEPGILENGKTVTFQFVVENTGYTTLSDVSVVEDEFTGTGGALDVSSCIREELAPGASYTCTADYDLTQADVDSAKFVSNKASATASNPAGEPVEAAESWTTVNGTTVTAMDLVKTARDVEEGKFAAGETIYFDFEVSNTGTTTINNVVIDESQFGGAGTMGAVTCSNGSLDSIAPGTTLECSASYVLQQEDVDRGFVENVAQGQGETGTGEPVVTDPTDPEEGTSGPTGVIPSGLSIEKTVGSEPASWQVGAAMSFHFEVTNTGATTLRNVNVVEGEFTGTGVLTGSTCEPIDYLAPGESYECDANYVLTQEDVDAGRFTNTASASGVNPEGSAVETKDDSTAVVEGTGSASLAFEKTVSAISAEDFKVGAKLVYTFTVENTGDVTITDVAIDESGFDGDGDLGAIACAQGSLAAIAPGEKVICTADYVLTQTDVDRGFVKNSASAGGKVPPGGGEGGIETDPDEATGGPEGGAALSALSITKTVAEPAAKDFKAGSTLNYQFVVENTGNTTLTDTEVLEKAFSGTGQPPELECPSDRTLLPGETMECAASYVMTLADINAGVVENKASAQAYGPEVGRRAAGGVLVEAEAATAVTTVSPLAGLKLTKTASPIKDADFKAGTQVDYQFLVENVGNVTVSDIEVVEGTFTGSGQMSAVTCPAEPLVLNPGEVATCTAYYVLTATDVANGSLSNTAGVNGKLPGDGGDLNGGGNGEFEVVAPEGQGSTAVVKPSGSLAVTGATIGGLLLAAGVLVGAGLWIRRASNGGNRSIRGAHAK